MIVALIAPILGIYYLYVIANSTLSESLFSTNLALFQTTAITIIILIAVDAAIIGFFVSKSITKPIKKLYYATKEIEKGNYDIKLDIKTNDEIEQLSNVFNRTAAALGKLEQEKKEIDKAKTEFLSITSHELRTPMTPMKAQLQMLEEGYFGDLNDEQKESLSIVIRNADRLDKIIVDFLEISRIEAARLKFDFKKTDLKKVIKETSDFMKGFAKEKNIELVVKIDDIPIIEADGDRVSQVLRNLISNAIKFSNDNSKIEIKAETKEDHIFFSVKDYGAGMTKEDQIRVFEPFYQVSSTLKRNQGGTGLGLAICRGIVEAQKGKIWVKSKKDNGSTFYFTFPLKPVKDIKPIKVLFSNKAIFEKKIKNEFKTILGPLGLVEFNDLKNQNAINKDDIYTYIDNLTTNYILDREHGNYFKDRIGQIFGEQKQIENNENKVKQNNQKEINKMIK